MPDITRKTVSASQVAGLFNRSPYCTRWMLYQHIKTGMPTGEPGEDGDRMSWGNRLEPAILAAVADELRLDVVPNRRYDVMPDLPLGCTRDADLVDPSLGYGVVEVKNVDGLIYKQTWDDEHAPPHIEIQHQAQMMVPHPTLGMPKWGVLACLVGGNELKILRRSHGVEMQKDIRTEVIKFFGEVGEGKVPDPLGTERELRGLTWLYPERTPGRIIQRLDDHDAASLVEEYQALNRQRIEIEKAEKALRVKLMAIGEDAEIVNVPSYEIRYSVQKRNGYMVEPSQHTTFKIRRAER
jgi:predicted phage-related endonuclease